MIKVFIVDDHYMVVEGIRSLLQLEKDIELIGSASSIASARTFLQQKQPDVILMDINLPDGNGIDLCKEVKEKWPSVFVLGISTFNQGSFIKNMMDNGASGYLLKNASQQELNEAIHQVAAGKTYLGFEVAKTLQAAQHQVQNEIVLGKREREALNYIKDGFTNGEISQKMGISINTVDTYRKSLLAKLNARNTAELIKVAVVRGLITFEE